MIKPKLPVNEKERLEALKAYQVMDTLPEQLYDDITEIASQICSTPISLISLLDDKRQWFKSKYGTEAIETPREMAFCAHAINESDDLMEVQDAFEDERFYDNPLTVGDPHVRFYAGAPLKTKDGFTLGTLCVIDHEKKSLSTGQKRALCALSRQVVELLEHRKEKYQRMQVEEDLTTLLENLGDGVFELDGKGKCIYANQRMLSMLNKTLSEVVNTSIWDMIYHEDVREMQEFYGEQFSNRVSQCYYEFRLHSGGREPFWVGQSTTMQYSGSRMIKIRSIARDLTENKELREELKMKESLYKLVSENSHDLIALHETDGTYKFVSLASKEMMGYEPSELIGKSPYNFMHPDDADALKYGPYASTIEGSSIENVDYRVEKKDGSFIWLESYTKPIFNGQEVISFQTSSRDITQKKNESEQLKIAKKNAEEASQAKNRFLSMMSHEIRTPLNGIIGTTHLLLSKSPLEKQLPHLNILKQSGNNLLAIVNDILDFDKIEQGKLEIDNTIFNLHQLVDTIQKNYELQASEKEVAIELSYDDGLSDHYLGDSVRIGQILHNLVSNALKFTKEGRVILSLSKINEHGNFDEIHFDVIDSGIGISQEKQKEIFEVFVQEDKSTTRNFGGSGLGLAITKSLLHLMDSEIQVQSVKGKGSEFSFNLILARQEKYIEKEEPLLTDDKSSALNAKILLVEDNAFNMAIAKDFLESWGCEVLEATNGQEALDLLPSAQVDLVLLDLQMPIMDGYDTIRAIRQKEGEYYENLPVIALTAAALGDDRDKVFQSGMNDFLPKPFEPEEFYSKLAIHLNKDVESTSYEDIASHIRTKLEETLGYKGKVEKYLNIFIETADEENKMLVQSIDTSDLIQLRAYAHKNKSSFKMIGLDKLAKVAQELEDMIDQKSPAQMVLSKAQSHYNDVKEILKIIKK